MAGPVSENGTPWNQLPGATGGVRTKLTPRPQNPITLFADLVKAIVHAVMGIFIPNQVITIPGGVNPLQYLSDLMGIRWAQVDTIQDGQLDLIDRVDLLSALEDRGSAYAAGQGDLINTGRVPFNSPVGPMKGARLENGGFTLLKQGAWDIDARLAFSFTAVPGSTVAWQIRVLRPDGSVFSHQKDEDSNSNTHTRGMFTTVVVPGPNYRVEVWITTLIALRATIGGPENNRLTVKHISDSTENPI